MADSPYLIFMLLLYVGFTSMAVALFASGIGGMAIGASGEALINYTPPEEESFWDGIPIIGETVDAASLTGSFLGSLFGVLFWTLPESIFPLWANFIFIKVPLIALIVSVLEVILP